VPFVDYLLSRIIRIEEDLVDQFFNFSERLTGASSVAVWADNQGIKARAQSESEPINPDGEGWNHTRENK